MFVTGPNVVKTLIHQEISSADPGGALIHGQKSGVAHFVLPNDILCLREVRRLINESMKMESHVASPCDGEVAEVRVRPGQAVETDEVLVRFKL